jgi:hypothetical protein
MAKVLGAGRLLLMALGTAVVTIVAVLVIGPWGWTAGVDVGQGAPLTGPVPEPSAEVGVLYRSPDGSVVVRDETIDASDDHTVRFDVTSVVRDDRTVEVTEDVTQHFGTPRHGIERTIPLHDDAGDHAMRSLVVSTDEGTPDQVSLLEGQGFDGVTVRVGDPDTTITGTHRYRLTYVLERAVTTPAPGERGTVLLASPGVPSTEVVPADRGPVDRVAFDAFSDWRQPIYGSTYTVVGPAGPVAVACYQSYGSSTPCASATPTADGAVFQAAAPVSPYQPFTVQVDWPEGTFGPAVVHGPERGSWSVRLAAVGTSLLGVVVVAVAAAGRRRLLWARTREGVVATFDADGAASSDAATSELVPASPRVDPPLEFVPPMGLRPAQLLRLDEGAGANPARLLAATVIDLAASGELELVAAARDEDWIARHRPGGAGRELSPYEGRVLSALFPEGEDEVRFGDRTESLSESRNRILEQLDDDLERRGLLARRLGTTGSGCGSRVVATFVTFAVAVAVAVGGGLLLRNLPWRPAMLLAGAAVGVAVALWGLAAVHRAGRDLTVRGLGASYRSQGFRRFFDASEEMHARAAADAGLLRQYLGYAVAFDAVDRWVGAFDAPDLAWLGTNDVALLTGWVYGSTIAHAATPPAPVSSGSGSSGFAGFGGGFGGGGGGGMGGGGGGSW